MTDADDAALLRQWAAGDDVAGRAFVDRHFTSVYRFFRSKIDRAAEDLTQQVFAACAAEPDRYRGEGTARAFVLGIARHTLYKHFRKERREAQALQKGELSAADLGGSPSSALHARTEVQLLHHALRRIPLDLQILIELQYWEETTMREIAEILEIPSGTVKTRLARARALLREEIEAARAEPDVLRSTLDGLDGWVAQLRDAMGP
jgi:RNA polymerase sigma-70 factor (ECF subfamily)